MRSRRPSSAGPSGVPFDVVTERLTWRIPTMNVSNDPTMEAGAAIAAAATTSLTPSSSPEGRQARGDGLRR
jgi:hypothetical protein